MLTCRSKFLTLGNVQTSLTMLSLNRNFQCDNHATRHVTVFSVGP